MDDEKVNISENLCRFKEAREYFRIYVDKETNMNKKLYYSERKNGSVAKVTITLKELIDYVSEVYEHFKEKGGLNNLPQEESGESVLLSIEYFNKKSVLPFNKFKEYSEEEVFDLIELFYDQLEEYESPRHYYSSGQQVPSIFIDEDEFSKDFLKLVYRIKINKIISNYGSGYELTTEGYVRDLISNGLELLVDSEQGVIADEDSTKKIKDAKNLFHSHKSDDVEKWAAITLLGGVLEQIQKTSKLNLYKKDENELFEVLNRFNIRHNRPDQMSNYDKEIFYPWIFYNLLSALDASLKIQKKKVRD